MANALVDLLPASTVEYFDSVDDVIISDDIIETDVKVLGWDKKFRIRALTFGQMDNINKKATDPETGNLKLDEWTYWTIVEGVVRPRFKIEQARRLADSNGEYVKALAEQIWEFGRISKKIWDEFVEESKKANQIAAEDFKDLDETEV